MKLKPLIAFLISLNLFAQQKPFDPIESPGELFEYAEYTNVGDNSFGIKELLNSNEFDYNSLQSANHSLGFTDKNYWVRFQLRNSQADQNTFYLETARPVTDIAKLYVISDGKIQVEKSGDQIPFEKRQVAHRSTVFKLILPAYSESQYYIHLKSDGETLNLPLNLYSETEFWYSNYKQQLFLGLFYGILVLAGMVSLIFYTSIKEKTFLYYGIYVFSIGLMQAALDGLIFQYFLPEGFINSRIVLLAGLFSTFFLLKYSEHFLKINQHLKKIKIAYNTIYAIIGLIGIMVFVHAKSFELAYPLANINGLLSLVLILVTVIIMKTKRIKIDPYFITGIFWLVIGLSGFVLNNLSVLPNNFYTQNSAKFGSGFEIIFLSISMTNLIRKMRVDREIAQDDALRKSEEVSGLKTYFMSNMSHELRTPINAIMNIAQIELQDNVNNQLQREKFQLIKNASLSLLGNVNDILDFEKLEKNELTLDNESFNPSELIKQISDNWNAEAKLKGLSYSFQMDDEIPITVMGDAERFIQIINNVLANAIKYTNQGSVKFTLKCVFQPNNICKFSIQISDTGIGINPEMQRYVFDSYNQMRLNHKREFGGIGLGLTITKKLVELFKGTINVESEAGKGTDIFIDLPLEYIPRTDILEGNPDELLPINLLVVEDNKINQMVMRKVLKTFNHISFKIANNGQEALNSLQENVYDVVLMDLHMPIMDGFEATRIIRSGELGPQVEKIPIIAVTADTMQKTKKQVMDLGMNGYMSKPINKELLLQKIESCRSEGLLKIA